MVDHSNNPSVGYLQLSVPFPADEAKSKKYTDYPIHTPAGSLFRSLDLSLH